MMRFFRILAAVAVIVLAVPSCNKEEKALENTTTSELFADACNCIPWTVLGNDAKGNLPWFQFWNGYLSESNNNQYGQLDIVTEYTLVGPLYQQALRKLDRIIQLNEDPQKKDLPSVTGFGSADNQIAAARTLSAYFYMFLTDMVGPIVFTEAFVGNTVESYKPVYMTQKEVYKLLDQILSEAYNQFDSSGTLYYSDLVYNGKITKWKKLNASLRMLLAIKLSDVDPANGKSRFAKAYSDGGMTHNEDSFTYTYGGSSKNLLYLWCANGNPGSTKNIVPNRVLVEKMKELKDPRMFAYFDIEGYKGSRDEADFPRKSYSSFYGAPFGVASNKDAQAFGEWVCSINNKMVATNATIPVIPLSRILFTEAEAAYRGWISADAKTLYNYGIQASFEWWSVSSSPSTYYNSAAVALTYDPSAAIEQIALQRWIASYLSNGVEVWSDWRRLNYPKIPVGPAAINKGIDQYPYRLKYHADNSTNYTKRPSNEILKDLRGATDEPTSRLWWDVAENTKAQLTEEECQPPKK